MNIDSNLLLSLSCPVPPSILKIVRAYAAVSALQTVPAKIAVAVDLALLRCNRNLVASSNAGSRSSVMFGGKILI